MAFGSGGWRLMPEREYLLESNTFDEFLFKYREASGILEELENLRIELRDAYKEQRRLELQLNKARSAARGEGMGMRGEMFQTEEMQEARETRDRVRARLNAHMETVSRREDEHEQLARHIDRRFVAVPVDRDVPDTSAPPKAEIMDNIGRPVSMAG